MYNLLNGYTVDKHEQMSDALYAIRGSNVYIISKHG